MSNTKFFVAMDSDQIQGYVFATKRLREIRGASALLSKLNEPEEVAKRVSGLDGTLHYAGGGSIKATFENEEQAKQFILNEQGIFAKDTITATITGIIEITEDQELKVNFGQVNHRAERKLRRAKEEKRLLHQIPTFPYAHLCESCRLLPAEKRPPKKHDPETRLLCEACLKKFEAGEPNVLYLFGKFCDWLTDNGSIPTQAKQNLMPPKDLDGIGKVANNHIGLVVCDGNRVGEHLKGLESDENFRQFSDALRKVTQNEIYRAISDVFSSELQSAANGNKITLPIEFVLIGGDDVVVIVPANKAIAVAKRFCVTFQKQMKAETNEDEVVSMSAGVAIAHSHYPLHALHRLADDLLKSAKKCSMDILQLRPTENTNMLDFMVISTPSSDPVSLVREDHFEFVNENNQVYQLYARPYRTGEEGTDEDDLGKLLNAIAGLKAKGFPRNVLHHLFRAMHEARRTRQPDIAEYHFLLRRTRMSKEVKETLDKLFLEKFYPSKQPNAPWRDRSSYFDSPLADLVELYDFVERS